MITIIKTTANLYLKFKYNPTYIKIIKCLTYRKFKNKTWIVPTLYLQKVIDLFNKEYVPFKIIEKSKPKLIDYKINQPKLKLFPKQEECVQFALNKKNVILNMSIGFGKTATALTTIISTNAKNCLIIVPASLKRQWVSEIIKFTDKDYCLIEGSKKKRIYNQDKFFTVVSYATARVDIELINKFHWDYVILDEIVKIKNHKSKTSIALKTIKANNRLALSGAILENRVEELYNILNFVRPELFSNYWDFKSRFIIMKRRRMGSIQFWETIGLKNLDHLKNIMSDFVIKKKLTDLPIKREITRYVKMLPIQKKQHKLLVEENLKIIDSIDMKLQYERLNENTGMYETKINGLTKMIALRQICNSPELIGLKGKSNKIVELIELLKDTGDDKVIIFSQFKKFTDMIYGKLSKLYSVDYVNGQLSSTEKESKINHWRFNSKILLATDCISYGINLQEANVMVNMDLPWNPIVLQQRIGRIWRRGQKNNCLIINLLSEGSIEVRLLKYLNNKIRLINTILDDDVSKLKVESNKEILLQILKGEKK